MVPNALPFPEGIEVSFRAYDIREGAGVKTDRGVAVAQRADRIAAGFGGFQPSRPPLSPPVGCTRRSDAGSERMPVRFTMQTGGETSPFIDYLSGLVTGDSRRPSIGFGCGTTERRASGSSRPRFAKTVSGHRLSSWFGMPTDRKSLDGPRCWTPS